MLKFSALFLTVANLFCFNYDNLSFLRCFCHYKVFPPVLVGEEGGG